MLMHDIHVFALGNDSDAFACSIVKFNVHCSLLVHL
jgi:hypothetical protein